MKKKLFFNLLVFCISIFPIKAQTDSVSSDGEIYGPDIISKETYFPGGSDSLKAFIKKNFMPPSECCKGKIFVAFTINTDSTLSDIRITKGGQDCIMCQEAVLELIKKMPKWIPSMTYYEKPIRRLITLPITLNN